MSYVIFCSDLPTTCNRMPDLCREIAVRSLGEAIETASRLIDDGITVWRLKGVDGLTMERNDIELEHLRRRALRIKSQAPV